MYIFYRFKCFYFLIWVIILVANTLIDSPSLMDKYSRRYKKILDNEYDIPKNLFRCPGDLGTWVNYG